LTQRRQSGWECEARVVFVAPEAWVGDAVTIGGEEHHHLVHVLRRRAGDRVEAVDGRGMRALLEIESVERREARAVVVSRSAPEPRPEVDVRLIPCVTRPARMDWLVEKATEMGVSSIAPACSARSVVRPSAAGAAQQAARWRRVAVAAMKQSRRSWLPAIEPAVPLAERIEGWRPEDRLLVPWEEAGGAGLRAALGARPIGPGRTVGVVIGPEGGLEAGEVERCRAAGGEVIGLGRTVLRAETAALVVTAILLYEGGLV
jgi:16S rRNA (uracil1498-N3)-methyltransferase